MPFCFVHEITHEIDLKTKNLHKASMSTEAVFCLSCFTASVISSQTGIPLPVYIQSIPFATINSPLHISFPSSNPISKKEVK